MASALKLGFGLTFEDLYTPAGTAKVDAAFISHLAAEDVELHNRLLTGRAEPEKLAQKDESALLISLAPHAEDFIAKLFGIEPEVRALARQHHDLADLYNAKRLFIRRRIAKLCPPAEGATQDGAALAKQIEELGGEPLTQLSFAKAVMQWLDKPEHDEKLLAAARYASWALNSPEGKKKHKDDVLFQQPKDLNPMNLVPCETAVLNGMQVAKLNDHHLRFREGFALTDNGGDLLQAMDDANYCIFCHNQGKDSCSKGMREKPQADGSTPFKKNALDIMQAGCPLEEKISEMNTLKADGVAIGALAMVVVDNPMCAGTGHRICNDCMKSCIYQKQEPVNIPRTETRTLKDVLELPWGFEIYSLLTRWNPLNLKRAVVRPDTGYRVLVVGLGPAGFTLAHHLLNDGHTVVAVEGLKLEPMDPKISGVTPYGELSVFEPVRDVNTLFENLDERTLAGFGGVAEYGITVRWNKNYLKIIRLLLERRREFAMLGGVRFGSNLNYDSAFKLGFDHIALAMGAGKPTIVSMPNALARGVRTASDFLMALQLTGAGKKDSIANLQLRLPVVVIGGGLTAVDAATESLAYYPLQVEKFLRRYETLVHELGEERVRERWSEEEASIAEEFIIHARAIREERKKAASEGRNPNLIALLQSWGGATVAYRKRLVDAPSYRLNHEEVEKALEEGIYFLGNVTPAGVRLDEFGHARALRVDFANETAEGIEIVEKDIPARSIFMAAGTNPNTVLQREDPKHFSLHGKYFAAIDENGESVVPEQGVSKPKTVEVLMAKSEQNKFVSFFGDLHPSYVGNVVKAMGSAKQGYPVVTRVLAKEKPLTAGTPQEFLAKIRNYLSARVHDVVRLAPNIVEVILHAPSAAKEFEPGQFYRLQNYEYFAPVVGEGADRTRLAMEGLALTGAWVDKEKGLLSTIVLEMGGSSDLCATLPKGEPVVLMGPTGIPTETPGGETVMLVGGGLGNAVLFSIGKALRAAGSKVLYFAGYRRAVDRYKIEEIEAAADTIIWCCDETELKTTRPGDVTFKGNMVQAIIAYAEGKLGEQKLKVQDVDRIVAIGSDRMMAAVSQARHTSLRHFLKPDHVAVASINSPMQCMMKEICAQCLQKHQNPATGERYYVYSCFCQDQHMDEINFQHLNERLKQNSVQEKVTALWIDRAMRQQGLRAVAA